MKNYYLLAALMTLILLSCKKEIKDLTGDKLVVSSDDYTISNAHTFCTGSNTWENGVTYVGGDRPDLQVVYNNKVYFFHNNYQLPPGDPQRNKIYIYDGISWQTLSSNIPFEPIYIGFAFVIGNKGYFGYTQYVGSSSHGQSYEYDFASNTWTAVDDFPSYYLQNPAYFTIGSKGYVTCGYKNGAYSNETWEFNPSASPQWRKRANFSGIGRDGATGFNIGSKGYVANGLTVFSDPYLEVYHKSLFEYNPSTNTWAIKTSFPGDGRRFSKSFVIAGYGYVGGGSTDEGRFTDFYKYDPTGDDWIQIPDYTDFGTLRQTFSINSKGYAVWTPNYQLSYRLKKFTPRICTTQGPVIP